MADGVSRPRSAMVVTMVSHQVAMHVPMHIAFGICWLQRRYPSPLAGEER